MDISQNVLDTLKFVGTSNEVDIEVFNNILEVAFLSTSSNITPAMELRALNKIGQDNITIKQLYGAVSTLALEFSRHDCNEQEITTMLEDRLTQQYLTSFLAAYNTFKHTVRNHLSTYSSSTTDIIVDIKWRIDYEVQSTTLEQVRKYNYWITLVTQSPEGERKNVEFACSVEQLQDLLANVKDACNVAKHLKI